MFRGVDDALIVQLTSASCDAEIMDLKQIRVKDLTTLHQVFRGYRSHDGMGVWYRGHANVDWELLPKAGRHDYYLPDDRDLGRFNRWRSQAIAHCTLPTSELEQLALAQHHGLATRLLDWTKNPLVAAYFAVAELPELDGAIYILEMPETIFVHSLSIKDLKDFDGVYGYLPNAFAPRILNQKGMFTAHCDAARAIEIVPSRIETESSNLIRAVIPAALKKEVLNLLHDYGIDRSVLFPDLDGLSMHVNSDTLKISEQARSKSVRRAKSEI